MDGEILTSAKLREAGRHADEIEMVVASLSKFGFDMAAAALQPSVDFLREIQWTGAER